MINYSHCREISIREMEEHAYHMQIRGYSVFPNFLDSETCDLLRDKLMHAIDHYQIRGTERSVLDKYLIHDLLCQDILFSRLLEDPRLQEILSVILGQHWILYAFTSSSLPPHGDNYGSRLHVDTPRFIHNYPTNVGVMWALDDFTLENGATKVLPGSHHDEKAPSEDFFEQHCAQLTCTKGSFIVFNARVWHRAGVNKTERWRHSLTMNACRSYMKQRMDWVRFIPPEISGQLNDQARKIIGFDTRLPTNLDEFFLPEDQRLYKANQG